MESTQNNAQKRAETTTYKVKLTQQGGNTRVNIEGTAACVSSSELTWPAMTHNQALTPNKTTALDHLDTTANVYDSNDKALATELS